MKNTAGGDRVELYTDMKVSPKAIFISLEDVAFVGMTRCSRARSYPGLLAL